MVSNLFLIIALLLFLAGAFSLALPKIQVGWLGLAFYTAAAVWVALKFPGG